MDFKPLVQELGIETMPQDQQQAILSRALSVLQKRMTLRMARELSDEQIAQFEAAAKNGDDSAGDELERIYPNFKQAYQEEIDQLREDFKALLPPR